MCPAGFELGEDWKTCQDVDECAASEAVREGECGGRGCKNTLGEREREKGSWWGFGEK